MLWNDLTALINNPELCYADFAMGANLEMTVAALLVYAAFADYKMDEREIGVIRDLTRRRFGFDDFVLENLIINAQLTEGHELQMEKFIKTLKKNLRPPETLQFYEDLWRILVADGKIHPYEQGLADFAARHFNIDEAAQERIKQSIIQEVWFKNKPAS
ncbi:MAG: TerB family tellurite resistance protein [Pseudomonadota bacterium]|nr:TerB family tellurite resistance protein [Pseudomonadota bacterium]QKK05052.1 MAG: TerB family tellurite resistance protein [Pseudomonadota bacterium]